MSLKYTNKFTMMSPPTRFPGYNEFPTELKLQIVREAAAELKDEFRHSRSANGHREEHPLSKYACIDRVWQDIIERHNFDSLTIKRDDIQEFGEKCRKRHGILRKITLFPYPSELSDKLMEDSESSKEVDINQMNSELKTSLHALFNIMKNWRPKDRRRRGLMVVEVNLMDLSFHPVLKKPVSVDFSGLPKVNVIGRFIQGGGNFMDPSTTIAIYRKLPNLDEVSLNLFWQPKKSEFLTESMSALYSLRRLPRVPSKVSLCSTRLHNGEQCEKLCQAGLPILKCLTSPGPRWSDTITDLSLTCINDVPKFIQQFQMTSWPQLRGLLLFGGYKSSHSPRIAEVTGVVMQSFISALPKIPKVTNIAIYLQDQVNFQDMSFTMLLNPKVDHWNELPSVPHGNNGFAEINLVSIPGRLAQQLQDVIWSQHGRGLEVFCMPWVSRTGRCIGDEDDDDLSWGTEILAPLHRCKRWNAQKSRWDRFTSVRLSQFWRREWVPVDHSEEPGTLNTSQK